MKAARFHIHPRRRARPSLLVHFCCIIVLKCHVDRKRQEERDGQLSRKQGSKGNSETECSIVTVGDEAIDELHEFKLL